jgi:lipopolysaccharide/colanic/teichoic acid biosynthesis glycosyltransferase
LNAKRTFDLLAGIAGLCLLLPLFIMIAAWIKLDDGGPVFYRQERVGRKGRLFKIFKFRTMAIGADKSGLPLTVGADPRITRSGAVLRRYKLDELPQLLNVVLGDMSLVGPRPEVPRYVAHYTDAQRAHILSVRPGITDPASILFVDENELLSRENDPERAYVRAVLPRKLALYDDYVRNRTFWGDVAVILKTLRTAASRPPS